MTEKFGLIVGLLLFMVGLYMLVLLRGNVLRPLAVIKCVLKKSRTSTATSTAAHKGTSGAQALFTALAGSIGTGNIAGVAAAIAIGGAGAIFWMWVSGILGMATKYAEVYIAVKHRKKREDGSYMGGAMFVMRDKGGAWKYTAGVFAFFTLMASLLSGNMVQVNTMADAVAGAAKAFEITDNVFLRLGVGIVTGGVLIAVMSGGAKSIGRVSAVIVPIMSAAYIAVSLVVILENHYALNSVFLNIINGAFGVEQAVGGIAGFSVARCIKVGAMKGIFSNEAGMGSAPIAYAAADYDDPRTAACTGVVEVFVDTIVLCTVTAVTVLSSGVNIPYGDVNVSGMTLVHHAMGTVIGDSSAGFFLAAATVLFAFTSMIGWSLYGASAMEFLLKERGLVCYKYIFCAAAIAGTLLNVDFVWTLGETANSLMAIPNILLLISMRDEFGTGINRKMCYNRTNFKFRGKGK